MSIDAGPSQGAFARSLELNFPLLSDWPRYETAKAYDVWRDNLNIAARVTYVIDREGVIRGVVESETDMDVHSREALRIVGELAGK